MAIPRVLGVALLVSAALTTAACGSGGDSAASGAPSSSAGSSQAAATSAPPTSSPSAAGGGCRTPAAGHEIVHISQVDGVMATVTGKDATMTCSGPAPQDASFRVTGTEKVLGVAAGISSVTVITKAGRQARTVKEGGLAHVQVCADPHGSAGGTPIDSSHEYCYGRNYYDIVVGPDHRITAMTELYGS